MKVHEMCSKLVEKRYAGVVYFDRTNCRGQFGYPDTPQPGHKAGSLCKGSRSPKGVLTADVCKISQEGRKDSQEMRSCRT